VLTSQLGSFAVRWLLDAAHGVLVGEQNKCITATSLAEALSKEKPLDPEMPELMRVLGV